MGHGAREHAAREVPQLSSWLTEVDPWVPEVAPLPGRVEIVIGGGGILGVGVAYWLARSGMDVLLLEARGLGSGASGRNAGLFLGGSRSLAIIREVLAEERIEAEYEETGHLALASSEKVLEHIRQEVAACPAGSRSLHVLGRLECEELLGMRIAEQFVGGRWMPVAAAVHPARLVHGLARAAMRRRARVATGCPVLRIRPCRQRGELEVATSRGTVYARNVVLACNSASAQLWEPLRKVLSPMRGQVLATRPLPRFFRLGLAMDYGTVYWRQAADGTVVLGGYHNLDPAAEATGCEALNPKIQAALSRFLPEAFPGFPPLQVARRWVGIMDETLDGRPVVGAWPGGSGVWVAAGFGGHGLPPALGTARALARAITDGCSPPELGPLDPARFQGTLSC